MKHSTELMSMLYHQLGRVFFLVAYADKDIQKKEVEALRKKINEYWLDYDETWDEFAGDTAFQIEFAFDYLVEKPKSENAILTDFKDFVAEYDGLFNDKLKKLIVDTSEAIADAYAGTSKVEQKIIDKIKSILSV
jgi:uncharacterized tellurite resistance protein B-like protein